MWSRDERDAGGATKLAWCGAEIANLEAAIRSIRFTRALDPHRQAYSISASG